ncbi:Lrp/AsnC ligand binding domain-containing protein [Porphyromonadaceae bacterium W3.11]|nr:Lrp/AsnC ligand binding domain-containing protein [Porphyromonadaceae bacterium W3.11]
MKKVDDIDIKILNMLILDARVPFQEIANHCGLSRAAIHQRIQRMSGKKIIQGSGYQVDYGMLGMKTCSYIGIVLEKGSLYESVCSELDRIQEIVECNFTTGPYNMLIKLYARDNDHLMQILNGQIQGITGVRSTETLISLKQSFSRPYLLRDEPVEEEETEE